MKLIATIFLSALVSSSALAANGDKGKNIDKAKSPVETAQAEKSFSVSGSVVDEKSNESLAGAAVYVDGKKIYTDFDGHFALSVPKPGKYTVKVELISYETTEKQINIQGNSDLNIGLLQK